MGREEIRFEQLLRLLPNGWEAKAKELGAFQRARGIQTPEELLRLILMYLTEGKSYAGTSAIIQLADKTELSKVAVFKRMRNSAAWLQWLCENIYHREGFITAKPKWLKNKNVILIDGSEDIKCGVRRQCYMLHYSLELFTLAVRELLVTDQKTGEKLANFKLLGKNDIVMGDRAYGNMPRLTYLKRLGAGYAPRIQSRGVGNWLYTGKRRKIDLLECLSPLKDGEIIDIRAKTVINGTYEPIRICAMRKDKESERSGLKRLVKTNQRKKGGKPISEEQHENNKYIIIATSLGKEVSAAEVLELYRTRWQIELAFKRLKSLFHYNDLPAKHSESARAWFYGKLLLAALCETLVNTGRFSPSQEKFPQIWFT